MKIENIFGKASFSFTPMTFVYLLYTSTVINYYHRCEYRILDLLSSSSNFERRLWSDLIHGLHE